MTYQEAEDFLFNQFASFQREGKAAFNKSLDKTYALLEAIGNPHKQLKAIHVAGTNGKGSSCHMLSSILQEAGFKTGLYTSPHLKSFTERIRVNGQPCSQEFVARFVTQYMHVFEALKPSFFEITTIMSFAYFVEQQVDIAVIETGLGGKLDSTNVIHPEVSLITSISLDHQDILGNDLHEIAKEKAGIIKQGIPVVISDQNESLKVVFEAEANANRSEIAFSDTNTPFQLGLLGNFQQQNAAGVVNVITTLQEKGYAISHQHIELGLIHVVQNTGLKGRLQQLANDPLTICDTGHNEDGIKVIIDYLTTLSHNRLFIIFGIVKDKSIESVLALLPKQATYFFTQAHNPRAMRADELQAMANRIGLEGEVAVDVNKAIEMAKKKAKKNDVIFVGGSTFVVAEIRDL